MPIDTIGMVRTLLELAVGLLSKMEDDRWATDYPFDCYDYKSTKYYAKASISPL